MPHYFVDVRLGHIVIHDTEGADFEDLGAANAGAVERSKQVLERALPQLSNSAHEIEITEG
jgi:hypothetical protein